MNKSVTILLLILLILILTGCQSSWKQPIPDGEIVFQVAETSSPALGFIQADGENPQTIEISEEMASPDWSADGMVLYGLTEGKGSSVGWPAYWDLKDGRFKSCKIGYAKQILGAGNSSKPELALITFTSEILLIDIDQCKKIETLVDVSDLPDLYSVDAIYYLPNSRDLIYGVRKYDYGYNSIGIWGVNMEFTIIRLNLSTGEKSQLAIGVSPTLSPDHSQIAFIGIDGLYVMNVDGTQSKRLLVHKFLYVDREASEQLDPLPRWSPDGKWLVFHLCEDDTCAIETTPIYKLSVETGEMIKIATGGWYPSWRP